MGTCRSCGGSGKETCSNCGGRGYQNSWNSEANGYTDQTCSRCGGSGRISCYTCGGSGQVADGSSSGSSSSSYTPSRSGSGGGSSEYERVNSRITSAVYRAQRGDLDGAIDEYNSIIEYCEPRSRYGGTIKGQMHLAYFNMGIAYKRKGDWDNAIENLIKGIGASSVSSGLDVYFAIGEAYYKKTDYDNAIEYYTKSIDSREGVIVSSYYMRGLSYAKKGDDEQAIVDYKNSADWGTVYGGVDKDLGLQNLKNRGIDYTPQTPPEIIQERQERAERQAREERERIKNTPRGKFLSAVFGLVCGFGGALTIGWIYNNITGAAKFPIIPFLILLVVGFIAACDSWYLKKNILFLVMLALSVPGWLIMFHILPERINIRQSIKSATTQTLAITQQADITSNVNFRKGPSTNDEIIRQLKKGDTVTLTGEVSGGWSQITHDGDTGWVSSEFLKVWGAEQAAAPQAATQQAAEPKTAALTAFPSDFTGTWRRDNYNNTLTFTEKTLNSSSQTYTWNFIAASADAFTIRSDTGTTAKINIKLANNGMVISGDSGGDEDNWNGTWKKQ